MRPVQDLRADHAWEDFRLTITRKLLIKIGFRESAGLVSGNGLLAINFGLSGILKEGRVSLGERLKAYSRFAFVVRD
jgi:hypothetical protein